MYFECNGSFRCLHNHISFCSTIHVLQPLINQNSNFPIKYNFNNAVLQQNATNFQLLNDSTLNVDFGLISTLGINKSIISPTLQMQLPFQVKNDPLNAFLMQSYIHIAVGHSSLKLPVQITGPAINPVLSLQKSVKVILNFHFCIFISNFRNCALVWTLKAVAKSDLFDSQFAITNSPHC